MEMPSSADNTKNVVALFQAMPHSSEDEKSCYQLIEQIYSSFSEDVQSHLVKLLDGIDDVLFDLADQASSNQEQNLYFQAMREIRIDRQNIESSFKKSLSESLTFDFKALQETNRFSSDKVSNKTGLADFNGDDLSLIEENDFEKQLAINGMIHKVETQCHDELIMLEERLTQVLGIGNEGNLLSSVLPESICQIFVTQTETLAIDIQARIVLYKLFDRYVLCQLRKLYHLMNERLKNHGVLPSLTPHQCQQNAKANLQKSENKSEIRPEQRSEKGTGDALDKTYSLQNSSFEGPKIHNTEHNFGDSFTLTVDEQLSDSNQSEDTLYHKLKSLLALQRKGGQSKGQGGEIDNPIPTLHDSVPLSNDMPHLETDELLQCLSTMQHDYQAYDSPLLQAVNQKPLGEEIINAQKISQLILTQNQFDQYQAKANVHHNDQDTINLVSMLFEFILDDHNLADSMKALIARLQIPIIKVALKDPDFFNKGNHPARRLLNEIATAALGWQPAKADQADPLIDAIGAVVQRILAEFSDNIALFDEVLNDFVVFMAQHKKRVKILEQRLCEHEAGQAKSELVDRTILQILSKPKVTDSHEMVREFLQDVWCYALRLAMIKSDSEKLRRCEAVLITLIDMGDLILAIELPQSELESKSNNIKSCKSFTKDNLTTITQEIECMIEWASLPLAQCRDFLQFLHGAMYDCFDQPILFSCDNLADTGKSQQASIAKQDQQGDTVDAFWDDIDKEIAVFEEDISHGVLSDSWQDAQKQTPEPAELNQASRTLKKLCVGSWVDINNATGQFRCKLAAIIRGTGKYIFVDRSGIKVAEYRHEDLLAAIDDRTVNLLDNALLFDRALESVIGNLRQAAE